MGIIRCDIARLGSALKQTRVCARCMFTLVNDFSENNETNSILNIMLLKQ